MIECFFGIMLCVGMLMLAEILVVCWVINKLKEFGEKIESLIKEINQIFVKMTLKEQKPGNRASIASLSKFSIFYQRNDHNLEKLRINLILLICISKPS
jgi:hypothetical protein